MVATIKGNTLIAPPRMTGDPQADDRMVQRWMNDLYDQLAKVNNVTGTLSDHELRIAALEARVTAVESEIAALSAAINANTAVINTNSARITALGG